jgi:hypothetical protein
MELGPNDKHRGLRSLVVAGGTAGLVIKAAFYSLGRVERHHCRLIRKMLVNTPLGERRVIVPRVRRGPTGERGFAGNPRSLAARRALGGQRVRRGPVAPLCFLARPLPSRPETSRRARLSVPGRRRCLLTLCSTSVGAFLKVGSAGDPTFPLPGPGNHRVALSHHPVDRPGRTFALCCARIHVGPQMLSDLQSTPDSHPNPPQSRSPAARRMARHRRRRQDGMRCVTVELRETEIDQLIGCRLLAPSSRADPLALRKAVHGLFDQLFP